MHLLFRRFKRQFAVTITLVVLEAVGWLLFPLFIGRAINSVIAGSRTGLYELAGLGIATMAVASLRRFYDSRVYARMYIKLSEELVTSQTTATTSAKTARLGMLKEIVEFLENSFPELINSVLGLVGTIGILAVLNVSIFAGCLIVAAVTVTVYSLTGKLTTRYNAQFNDEFERRVEIVDSGNSTLVTDHVRNMMRWNIKLSDLETVNFGIVWIFMVGLLAFSVGAAAEDTIEYGAVFAVVMYVFQFVESIAQLPLYYQQWLRLQEITRRLDTVSQAPSRGSSEP